MVFLILSPQGIDKIKLENKKIQSNGLKKNRFKVEEKLAEK